MTQEKTHIAVIIPTFNRKGYLSVLLNQLAEQKEVGNLNIVPVIVIDGSNDGTQEMLKQEYPHALVLDVPGNWWWTKSVNEGIKYAFSKMPVDYILLLNDDSQIEADYLSVLMKTAQETGPETILGSISVTDSEPKRVSFSGVKEINWVYLKKRNYYRSFIPLKEVPQKGLYPTYALNGRGTLVHATVIKKLNLLDEKNFPQYGSDDDLALRGWKNGYKVLLSYSSRIIDRTQDTSKGTAFRQDKLSVFIRSFFTWHSVNYIPKQLKFFYIHGIKLLIPFYFFKFIAGTSYAYFFKYKKMKNEL